MPSQIRVLDEHTINKIAAGEVVENPASAVKELVENAVDAGADDICVEIKGGGRQLIRITDNGKGMNPDDALLCLERHATSKIREIDDVHNLFSMGFRGEAVPSIASISKMTLLTRTADDEEGTLVIIEGGRILKCSPAVRSPGTTMEVKSLFFNVPVRKKFQRAPTYDTGEVLKVVTLQALAHPNIKFQLISNQKNLLVTNLSEADSFQDRLGARISDILGSDFFVGICPVDKNHGDYQLQGFIGLPAYTRHNRTGQYLFINKRAVFCPFISYAVKEAYGTTLAPNRHPVYVLHLNMPGSLVDVNVHPQKREVRLRQKFSLKEMIVSSIEDALQQGGFLSAPSSYAFTEPPAFALEMPTELPAAIHHEPVEEWTPVQPVKEPTLPVFETREHTSPPKVIAAIPGYLFLTSEKEGCSLIDQRAAHSRILYERLSDQSDNRTDLHIQNLLIPYTLETTPIEAAAITEILPNLNKLGINIEEFGNQSFIVHAIPQIWAETNIQQLITEIANHYNEHQSEGVVKEDIEKRLAVAAGRAAVSQRKKLSLLEGQSLVNQLMRCRQPHVCPQGKPIMVEMTSQKIAKQFEK